MKKVLSFITAAVMALSIVGTGYQAKAMTKDEVNVMIQKTDEEIYQDIQNATEKADALVLQYKDVLQKSSNAQDYKAVQDNINDVINAFNLLAQGYGMQDNSKMKKFGISDLDNNLNTLKNNMASKIDNSKTSYEYNKAHYEFNTKLNQIIFDLINDTNSKVFKLKMEALKYGIIIQSEWIKVNIGGRVVLIDPCKTVGV